MNIWKSKDESFENIVNEGSYNGEIDNYKKNRKHTLISLITCCLIAIYEILTKENPTYIFAIVSMFQGLHLNNIQTNIKFLTIIKKMHENQNNNT